MTKTTAAEQQPIPIKGATNFRSLGGLPTRDGRRIRPHAILRADRLSGLTAEDWLALQAAGLGTICDLRSEKERKLHPNGVAKHLQVTEVSLAVDNDLRANSEFMTWMAEDPTARGAERVMIGIYRRFPLTMAGKIRAVIDLLLAHRAPLLIHCTAGKDRTGFMISILLAAIGVDRQRVHDDYLISQQWPGKLAHRPSLAHRLRRVVPSPAMDEVIDVVLDARLSFLNAAWEVIESQFGSVQQYLRREAGVDDSKLKELCDSLLV
jgi:protein-tyrosine phosphatase